MSAADGNSGPKVAFLGWCFIYTEIDGGFGVHTLDMWALVADLCIVSYSQLMCLLLGLYSSRANNIIMKQIGI